MRTYSLIILLVFSGFVFESRAQSIAQTLHLNKAISTGETDILQVQHKVILGNGFDRGASIDKLFFLVKPWNIPGGGGAQGTGACGSPNPVSFAVTQSAVWSLGYGQRQQVFGGCPNSFGQTTGSMNTTDTDIWSFRSDGLLYQDQGGGVVAQVGFISDLQADVDFVNLPSWANHHTRVFTIRTTVNYGPKPPDCESCEGDNCQPATVTPTTGSLDVNMPPQQNLWVDSGSGSRPRV